MLFTEKPKTERIVWILQHLIRNRTRRHTVFSVWEWLNQDEPVLLRNVQRDLKRLAETRGSCVQTEHIGGKQYYFIEPDMRDKLSLPIERNSLLALFLLKRLQPLFAAGAKTMQEITEALEELGSETGDELFDDLDEHLQQQTHVLGERSLLAMDNELLNTILSGLFKHRNLRLTYRRNLAGDTVQHTICPVKLMLANSDLYLVAVYGPGRKRNYYFKLCRVADAELLEEQFVLTEEQRRSVDKRLSTSFGIFDDIGAKAQKVVLLFPEWFGMTLNEKRFHNSQQVAVNRKGNAVCTMTVPVGDDLVKWVLGWGDLVTVQQPKRLRVMVREVARGIAARHR